MNKISELKINLEEEKANVVAIKKDCKDSKKPKVLNESFKGVRVKDYIEKTFGDSVSYHYVELLN